MFRRITLITLLLIIIAIPVAMILISCTGENALIRVKESTFCTSLPEGQYSIICEVTEKFGTTPEAVRISMKLTNLVAANQLYDAQQADAFLASVQENVKEFKTGGVVDWEQFGSYILLQQENLPPKLKAAFVIAKDLFEFNPAAIQGRPLSQLDWDRVLGNIAEQRAILAPFLK